MFQIYCKLLACDFKAGGGGGGGGGFNCCGLGELAVVHNNRHHGAIP